VRILFLGVQELDNFAYDARLSSGYQECIIRINHWLSGKGILEVSVRLWPPFGCIANTDVCIVYSIFASRNHVHNGKGNKYWWFGTCKSLSVHSWNIWTFRAYCCANILVFLIYYPCAPNFQNHCPKWNNCNFWSSLRLDFLIMVEF